MTNSSSPEKSPWGWKALAISFVLSVLFLAFFYLAVTNEPDYMPSQQHQENTQQHAFKTAPAMSKEALLKAQEDKANREAMQNNMTESHHMMEHDDASSAQH